MTNFHINQIADNEYEMLDENDQRIGIWIQYPDEWVSVQIDDWPSTIARDLGDAYVVSWAELRMKAEHIEHIQPKKPWWKSW